MLIQLLFASTAHFAQTVFMAFVFFAAGLLHFDSWQVDKNKRTLLLRGTGFFLLALAASFRATSLETSFIVPTSQLAQIVGLVLILMSLIGEPIMHVPSKKLLLVVPNVIVSSFSLSLVLLSAVLTFLIAATYFRKATSGLDKQLKSVFLAFFFLGLAQMLRIPFLWSATSNVFWSRILAEFGLLWNIHQVIEFIGIIILGFWVWGYLRFRLQIQLFITTVALTLSIFVITAFFFTFLLLKNLENDALSHLKTDVRVVQYGLERQQAEALAIATAVAQNSELKKAFFDKNESDLYKITSNLMLSYNTNFLAVTNNTGQVIMRGEDKDNRGDSLVFDPTVKAALEGHRLATVVSLEGAIAPRIQIKAAAPFYESSAVGGVISTGFWIDSAFVDGVKEVTGLDVTVFGGNKRAATTFVAPDGKSRFVGTLETNRNILTQVLKKGEIYIGPVNVLNQPYYSAYAPLETYSDKSIGMLFVGKPQLTLFAAAKKSIDLTFLGSVILMILSIIPAYFLSRYIKEQLEA